MKPIESAFTTCDLKVRFPCTIQHEHGALYERIPVIKFSGLKRILTPVTMEYSNTELFQTEGGM